MEAPRVIPKNNASFPEYLSFQGLREQGIAHCQALAGGLWTDFNLHDPGLTILEALCFALTDLGYRTNLPFADLIARPPEQRGAGSIDDNFFTPEQILTCNPVTLLDLRKLLIDVPGVRNAWIEPAEGAPSGGTEVALYLNRKTRALQREVPKQLRGAEQTAIDRFRVQPRGLYNVCLELDDDRPDVCAEQKGARPTSGADDERCGAETGSVGRILTDCRRLLDTHRNLCEDVADVSVLGLEEIALCADIEIAPTAKPEDVLVELHRRLEAFLSPRLRFYSLQEMLARGKRIEDIYAGRPMAPLATLAAARGCGEVAESSHGFIDTDELAASERRTELHLSDLCQVVMDVPGVLAVSNLLAVNYINGLPQTRGERWCLALTPKHRQRLTLGCSQLTLNKGALTYPVGDQLKQAVHSRIREERDASTKAPLAPHQLDRSVPEGTHRDLADYRSIVHELPMVYGIGDGGLPASATTERKAQAKQLRAYLLFYDQILANYLAQLANLRELFSFRPDCDAHERRTYFTQCLGHNPERDIPGIDALLERYNDCRSDAADPDPDPGAAEDYPAYLNRLAEDPETHRERRNRFLDHLLARFAESFTDYVLLMFDVGGSQNEPDRIIRDKVEFLRTYPETSRDRGKGFDQRAPQTWDTPNLSGLEQRVARLLGIRASDCGAEPGPCDRKLPYRRRTLGHIGIVETEGGWHWSVALAGDEATPADPRIDPDSVDLDAIDPDSFDPDASDEAPPERAIRLKSTATWPDKDQARAALARLQTLASDARCVPRLTYGTERLGFGVLDHDGVLLAETAEPFDDPERRDLARLALIRLAVGTIVETELRQAVACLFPQLLDAAGETLLLDAVDGHPSEEQALAAFRDDLLPAAREPDHYRDLQDPVEETAEETGGDTADADRPLRLGFELLARPGGPVLARHPGRYATELERDLRKRTLLYYVGRPQVRIATDGEPGAFTLSVQDAGGAPLFAGARTYRTREDAGIAYRRLLRRAQIPGAYRRLDTTEGVEDFGFALVERDGDLLAEHPLRYPTAAERDAVIDDLVRRFCPAEDIRYAIRAEADAFRIVVLAPDDSELLRGAETLASEAEAMQRLASMLWHARRPQRYQGTASDDGYGYVLNDADGVLLATHPHSYADAAARDAAIRGMIAYACPVSVIYRIDGEPGRYYGLILAPEYSGLDPEDNALLRTTETEVDQPGARAAAHELAALGADPERYSRVDCEGAYGFELRDDDGPVATHGERYATAAERDAAIAMIVAYLAGAEPRHRLANPTGAFRFELRDGHGTVLLAGTRVLPSRTEAEAAALQARDLARDREHYRPTADGPLGCPFGFEIVDAMGSPVARAPQLHREAAERDQAMGRLYARVQALEGIPDVIDPVCEHGFEIQDHADTLLLTGIGTHVEAADAEAAFAAALVAAAAPDGLVATLDDVGYGFEVRDGETPLARHPHRYAGPCERDLMLAKTRFSLASGGAPYAIARRGTGGFAFDYLDPAGAVALAGTEQADDERGALDLLLASLSRAIDPAAYAAHDGWAEGTERFGFRLLAADGASTIAVHPGSWSSADARDAARDAWIAGLAGRRPAPVLVRVPVRYHWRLVDFDGSRLLRSEHHWPAAEQALAAFRKALGPVATGERDLHPINHNALVKSKALCRYGFELRGPSVGRDPCRPLPGPLLATHGSWYQRGQDRDDKAQRVRDLVRQQVLKAEAIGTACGHFFRVGAGGEALTSVAYYPTKVDASIAASHLLPSLADADAYCIESAGADGYRLIAAAPETRAASAAWPEQDRLGALRDALIAAADADEPLPYKLTEEAPQLRCRLSDDDGMPLLEGAVGPSAEVHAVMGGFPSRGSRDAALRRTMERFAATEPPQARIEPEDGDFRFAFDIDDGLILRGRLRHPTDAKAQQDAKQFTKKALAGAEDNYRRFDSTDGDHGFVVLDLRQAERNRIAACKACNRFAERAQEPEAYRPVLAEDGCAHGFRLVGADGDLLAAPARLFPTAAARDEQIGRIRCLADAEGFHVVEHLLLRPRTSIDHSIRPEAGEALLPVGDCLDADGNPCPQRSDSYSFRITVVVPYWSRRFRHPDFRPFFERTLRLETPAHVFPRICWADVCQMQAFESAYRRWLRALAHGPDSCDLAPAQRALVAVLSSLTSVYEPGYLSGCDGGKNPMRLNQTILGTAGTDHGDSDTPEISA